MKNSCYDFQGRPYDTGPLSIVSKSFEKKYDTRVQTLQCCPLSPAFITNLEIVALNSNVTYESSFCNQTKLVSITPNTAVFTNPDVHVIVAPSGTGSFSLDVPDNTILGGNCRGINAIDLQLNRYTANQVASGQSSFVGTGQGNESTGTRSVVISGNQNACHADNALIGNGATNLISISAEDSVIINGTRNELLASQSVITGGTSNRIEVPATNSWIGNGLTNNISGANSAIVNGISNSVSSLNSWIGDGSNNIVSANQSAIVAGTLNTVSGVESSTIAGSGNSNSGSESTIVGGQANVISAAVLSGVVVSGLSNTVSGNRSWISAGSNNVVNSVYSCIGAGNNNSINNSIQSNNFIGAGTQNVTTGTYDSIFSGNGNIATAIGIITLRAGSCVCSGTNNTSSGAASVVVAGNANIAGNDSGVQLAAFVGSGNNNRAIQRNCGIGGGIDNFISGLTLTDGYIGAGNGNELSSTATNSAIGGGSNNDCTALACFVGSGNLNLASAGRSAVGGGLSNTTSGIRSFIGGGRNNVASGTNSAVVGGNNNFATGLNATIPGGYNNVAGGQNSFVCGNSANDGNNDNCFVFADSTGMTVPAGNAMTFFVRASGAISSVALSGAVPGATGIRLDIGETSAVPFTSVIDPATQVGTWSFDPTVSSANWAVAGPTNIADALNRISTAMFVFGGAIP